MVLVAALLAGVLLALIMVLGAITVSRRLRRSARINDVLRLEGPLSGCELRDALRVLVGDATLDLSYQMGADGSWVDSDGAPVDCVAERTGRAVVPVGGHDGGAQIMVDVANAGRGRRRLRGAVLQAASVALEKTRLDLELRSTLDDVRASRLRLVRRSIDERNALQSRLHDQAQSALTAAQLQIGEARADLDDGLVADMVDDASRHLWGAVSALREIVGEIYAPQLRRGFLASALDTSMLDFPIPVAIRTGDGLDENATFDEQTAAAGFFTVTDVLRESLREGAQSASVLLARHGDVAVLAVTYAIDGTDADSDGWMTVEDRVRALYGTIRVMRTDGRVDVEVRLPCA